MFSLERLRVLHAVAHHGSVGGAATALHVTTSAISQQMAKLERETGQPLLVKNGRGVRLTDAGRVLAGHADDVLSHLERARAELEAQRGQPVGEMSLAAFPTAARGLAAPALVTLRRAYHDLRIRLREMEPSDSVPALVRGDIDLAIVLDWHNRPLALPEGLVKAPLYDDIADVAVPVSHPLAGRAEVALSDFAEDDWISWPQGEFCHEWLLFTLRGDGIEPRLSCLAEEHHTQLALVAAGLGVAVAPRLGRGAVPEGVALLPVGHTVRRHIYAIWRVDAERRPAIRASVQALRQAATAVRD